VFANFASVSYVCMGLSISLHKSVFVIALHKVHIVEVMPASLPISFSSECDWIDFDKTTGMLCLYSPP
jgi:hypothetical protein